METEKKTFSLTEVLITLIVLGILAAILIPNITKKERTKTSQTKQENNYQEVIQP